MPFSLIVTVVAAIAVVIAYIAVTIAIVIIVFATADNVTVVATSGRGRACFCHGRHSDVICCGLLVLYLMRHHFCHRVGVGAEFLFGVSWRFLLDTTAREDRRRCDR